MRNTKRTIYYAIGTTQHTEASFPVQVGMVLGIALLSAFLLVFGVGKSIASDTTTPPVGPGSLDHPKAWCGQSGQPVCRNDPGWFSVTSEQPDAIVQAMKKSPEYVMLQKRAGYVELDTPVRVRSLQMHTGIAYYDLDHWVTSARNTVRVRVGLFDFVYDAASQRLRFASFGVIQSGDVHAHMAFPYVAGTQVLAKLQRQPGVHLMAASQPELVFFQLDPRYRDLSSSKYRWYGGGDSPLNPLWHVVGIAGNNYFMGNDLHAYTGLMVKPLMVR